LVIDTLIRTLHFDMQTLLWLAICPFIRHFYFNSQSLAAFEIFTLTVSFNFIHNVCFDSHCFLSLAIFTLIHGLYFHSLSLLWFTASVVIRVL
jgi:hypothetical protein